MLNWVQYNLLNFMENKKTLTSLLFTPHFVQCMELLSILIDILPDRPCGLRVQNFI